MSTHRKFWPEVLGMRLYEAGGVSFYAWNYKHAKKKSGNKELFVISEYGYPIKCV